MKSVHSHRVDDLGASSSKPEVAEVGSVDRTSVVYRPQGDLSMDFERKLREMREGAPRARQEVMASLKGEAEGFARRLTGDNEELAKVLAQVSLERWASEDRFEDSTAREDVMRRVEHHVRLFLEEKKRALDEFCGTWECYVSEKCKVISFDRSGWEDLEQKVWVKLTELFWKKTEEVPMDKPEAFIWTVITRTSIDEGKKRARTPEPRDPQLMDEVCSASKGGTPQEAALLRSTFAFVLQGKNQKAEEDFRIAQVGQRRILEAARIAMDRLPEHQQDLLRWRVVEELPVDDVVKRLGKSKNSNRRGRASVSKVKTDVQRALEALRKAFIQESRLTNDETMAQLNDA